MFKIPNIDSIFTWKTCNFTVPINYLLFFSGVPPDGILPFFYIALFKDAMLDSYWLLVFIIRSQRSISKTSKNSFSKKIINLSAQLHFFYKWNIRISNIENKILLRSQETFFSSDLLTRCVLWVDLYVFAQ